MKILIPLVILLIAISSCRPNKGGVDVIRLGDTIQTSSGLKYYYIKKGKGRSIESGSKVGTYRSLKVDDSVVWNTNELPDSLFTFLADSTKLIKGFTEVSRLLREGDEIVAILPDSLAYGAKGAGDIIPPYATLVYNEFKVVRVEQPVNEINQTSELE